MYYNANGICGLANTSMWAPVCLWTSTRSEGAELVVENALIWEWLRIAVGQKSFSLNPPVIMQKPSSQHMHCSFHPQRFSASVGWTKSQHLSNEHLVSLQWKKANLCCCWSPRMLSFNRFNDWLILNQLFPELKRFLAHFSQWNVNMTLHICFFYLCGRFSGSWAFLGEQSPLLHAASALPDGGILPTIASMWVKACGR